MSVCFESMGIDEFLGEEIQIGFSIRGGERYIAARSPACVIFSCVGAFAEFI